MMRLCFLSHSYAIIVIIVYIFSPVTHKCLPIYLRRRRKYKYMPISGPYKNEAIRFREEIKKKFKTQIAPCNAIGAKDGSYVTGYVTGNNRIGNILREKLEAVGVDVNYILYGKRTEEAKPKPGSGQELSDLLFQCTEKIIHLQNAVIEMNKELLDVNQLLETVKKSVTKS